MALYAWNQTDDSITLAMAFQDEPNIKENLTFQIEQDSILLQKVGETSPRITGQLFDKIAKADSYWTIENQQGYKVATFHLEKSTPKEWPHVMQEDSPALDAHSQYEIAVTLESKENVEKSWKYFLEAAEKGSVGAQLKIAAVYTVGPDSSIFKLEPNLEEAFRWHLIAAEKGNPEGQFFAANAYQFGHGVETDYLKATQWYEKSILNSTTANVYTLTAIFNVGLIYKEGGHGIEADLDKGIKWWMVGDSLGSAFCSYNLAVLYLQGLGVEKDISTAISLFTKAKAIDKTLEIPPSIKAIQDELDEAKKKELKKTQALQSALKFSEDLTQNLKENKNPSKNTKKQNQNDQQVEKIKRTTWRYSNLLEYVGYGTLVLGLIAAFAFGSRSK